MSNIIKFSKRKFQEVYECECGCQHFYLTDSMELECKCCGKVLPDFRVVIGDADESN